MFTGTFTRDKDTLFAFVFLLLASSPPPHSFATILYTTSIHHTIHSFGNLQPYIFFFLNDSARFTVKISFHPAFASKKTQPSAMPSTNLPGQLSPPSSRSASSQPPSSPDSTFSAASPTPTTSWHVDYCLRYESLFYAEPEHDPLRPAPEPLAGT